MGRADKWAAVSDVVKMAGTRGDASCTTMKALNVMKWVLRCVYFATTNRE